MPEDNPQFADLPDELLDKLSTFTYGGFLLFYFDSKGDPRVESEYNEAVDAIALKKFALDILQSLDTLSRRRMTQELDHIEKELGNGEEEA